MSQITENTIVIPTEAEATFLQQVTHFEAEYRINGLTGDVLDEVRAAIEYS